MSVPNMQPTNAYNNPQIAGYNNMNSNYNMTPNNMYSTIKIKIILQIIV